MNIETQKTLEQTIFESPAKKLVRSPLLLIGLACIVVSFGLFLLQEGRRWYTGNDSNGLFLFHYMIAGGYLLTLIFQKLFRFRAPLQVLDHLMLFLVLALISCFSLNKEMQIFQPSVDWFTGWLIVTAVAMIGYSFRLLLPRVLQLVIIFFLGSGMVLFSYFALYLVPFSWVGLLGGILLGLGLHIFVPLFSAIALAVAATRMGKEDVAVKRTFLAGISVTLLFTLVYLSLWQAGLEKINRILNSYQLQENQSLPRWVALSQQVPTTPIFEHIVQTDLVYQSANESLSIFDFPERRFEDHQLHDPLVVVATRLFPKPQLTTEEKIKIMESRFNSRHLAQERLWSGTHLATSNIITQAQIFPKHRFSYTEKILTVQNNRPSSWGQEEAIYTFHLPEGSVVTSLSLWIKGREEKGYLTTQSKADSAYKTVVGVEARDPSVVHWQEGNTVSVRVFPCTPQESRQFKIGITSPLQMENGQLVYENIFFDGPSADRAAETTLVRLEDTSTQPELPKDFKSTIPGRFERYGEYDPDWKINLPAPALNPRAFYYDGFAYQTQEYKPQLTGFSPIRVYLDLNKAWIEEEFITLWNSLRNVKVYAYQNQMIKLTPKNHLEVFRQLQALNFSLFPLHMVKDPEQALLISKSTDHSPNLSDLKESSFADDFKKTALKQQPLRFFQLGQETTPYLKTLKELRLLQPAQGTLEELVQLLRAKQFVAQDENPNTVVLPYAKVKLTKTASTDSSQAGPDHLLRLFAYNHLLQQIGPNYFRKDYLEQHLIEEAAQANVVSPLSSLVVLETQEDYERFGIEESKNSLGNASVKSSGAVPEPHEWALIILVIVIVVFSIFKPRLFA
ncbi:XrtN system VIT domain-containing protein [Rufibacter aurantiacus]|uniref:XrtN system VIT domain-containing protein n=1 Tax=Rufibacter aurantiacus TaxID=2817374 RepID=UPI001B308188|nr:XrtN system VIT domain-containing protein [Rufibacter aurantiacus]